MAVPSAGKDGWWPFAAGVLLGLFAWLPMLVLLVALFAVSPDVAAYGLVVLAVPGLVQLPVLALAYWGMGVGATRRGLVVGGVIVAFLNASCWGLLLFPSL